MGFISSQRLVAPKPAPPPAVVRLRGVSANDEDNIDVSKQDIAFTITPFIDQDHAELIEELFLQTIAILHSTMTFISQYYWRNCFA